MTGAYLDRLAARTEATGTVLCLGLDPDPDALPDGFSRDVAGVERFASLVLEAALPVSAAVKPNLAFFEAFGSAGMAALERLRGADPGRCPVHRRREARRHRFDRRTAGRRAVRRARRRCRHGQPVPRAPRRSPRCSSGPTGSPTCCAGRRTPAPARSRTWPSRPGEDGSPAERLHERIARLATGWGPGGTVGLVVGATAPEELATIRAIAPGLAFLVPGRRRAGWGHRPGAPGRPGDRRPGLRRRRSGAARERLAGHRRSGARGPSGRPGSSASRPPPPSGPRSSLCYPSRRGRPARKDLPPCRCLDPSN